LASGAPPSPFETASGFFSTDRTRRTKVPRDPLLEFGSSTELACVALRPLSPLHRSGPLARTVPFQSLAGPPLLGFFLLRTQLRRVPLCARPGLATVPADEDRQTLVGAVLRVLAPLDGSGYTRGTARTLAELAVLPWCPDASQPCFMLLASLWRYPPELSLPGEPYPLSRAFVLPCGFAFDCRRRDEAGIFTIAFPAAPALCLAAHPEVDRDS